MIVHAPMRFLGEERKSFPDDSGKQVNFMKVVLQSAENITQVFEFNVVDEDTGNTFANLQPMAQGYALIELAVNKYKKCEGKLRGWQAYEKKDKK